MGVHPSPIYYRNGGDLAMIYENFLTRNLIPYYFPSIFVPNENKILYLEGKREPFFNHANTIKSYRREKHPSSRDNFHVDFEMSV